LLSKSLQERNRLLKEINELEAVKKSPSKLKKFAKTYLKGLKIVGSKLWKGIKVASSNIEKNSQELRRISKNKQTQKQPFSPALLTSSQIAKPRVKKKKSRTKSKRLQKNMQMAWDLP